MAYFDGLAQRNRLPTLGHLRGIARKLSKECSTTAYQQALRIPEEKDIISSESDSDSDIDSDDVEDGPSDSSMIGSDSESEPEAHNEKGSDAREQNPEIPEFKGDWPLANSILLVRDGLWFLEYCRAVASGDTGRIWEILKVGSPLFR